MRLISAGSLVQVQSRPPFSLADEEIFGRTQSVRGFKTSNAAGSGSSLTTTHSIQGKNYNYSLSFHRKVEYFVIKLLSAFGECLGAKRR